MELRRFIEEALMQICKGIKTAQIEAAGVGSYINPINLRLPSSMQESSGWTKEGNIVQTISFDIAVDIVQKRDNNIQIEVFTGLSDPEVKAKNKVPDSAITRIKFDLPILLPGMRVSN